jgi:peptidoglycan/LPS O-acetylase OafA/YrhL
MQTDYRPDIDGLRAIAILSVVSYHAFPTVVSGGFIGVDILFVISGYLISSIIFKRLQEGIFSLQDFYGRRIKRIFPALCVVLVANAVLGWLFLLPSEYSELGKHLLAGSAFVSNLLLWSESGYFNPAAELKPLLHLWSLGIEEQFYIFFPMMLLLFWRYSNRLSALVFAIAAASFVLNVVGIERDPVATFYSPVTRIWELMLGGLLAYCRLYRLDRLSKAITSETKANLCATAGFAAICLALGVLDSGKAFPGWWALLPTGGALLVITAGPTAWVNRTFLANPALVFIGLISYPLYLWHWPLLSFLSIVSNGIPSAAAKWAVVVLAFVLAWVTFEYVEVPIRRKRWVTATPLVLAALVSAIAFAGFGIELLVPRTRLDSAGGFSPLIEAINDWDFPGSGASIPGARTEKVLFIGDSFLEQYYGRIKAVVESSDRSYSVKYAGIGGCPPIPDVDRIDRSFNCIKINDAAFTEALNSEVDRVVIGSAWHYFYPITERARAIGQARFEHDVMLYAKGDAERRPIRVGSAAFASAFASLEGSIAALRKNGKSVYVVLPSPISDDMDPLLMIDRLSNTPKISKGIEKSVYLKSFAPVISELMLISERTGAKLLDPAKELCPNDFCRSFDGTRPIYKDTGHLRPYFVRGHITVFDEVLIAN